MKTENKVLMSSALESLKGNWGKSIAACLVVAVISMVFISVPHVGRFVMWFISGAFMFGTSLFFLNLSRGKETSVKQVFDGFKHYGITLSTYLLYVLFVFLWSLLFIIPGIIASFGYSQTFFILVDEPNLGPLEALRKSNKMMDGYKEKYFYLGLRFIGWALLCAIPMVVSFGFMISSLEKGVPAVVAFFPITMALSSAGYMFLVPYIQASRAKFYEDVKKNYELTQSTADSDPIAHVMETVPTEEPVTNTI